MIERVTTERIGTRCGNAGPPRGGHALYARSVPILASQGIHQVATFLPALHIALFAAISLRILARPQLDPHTRTAWILVLLVLPIMGAVLYVLIGEIHFSGPDRNRIDAAVAATVPAIRSSGEIPDLPQWGPASGFATSINGFGETTGNRGELLDSPEGARRRVIEDMDAAVQTISVLYYIWLDDGTGRAVAEALIRAARRGDFAATERTLEALLGRPPLTLRDVLVAATAR